MRQRKYSVREIDRMRDAISSMFGSHGAEDKLRTYMMNGTDPAELEEAARPVQEARAKMQKHVLDAGLSQPRNWPGSWF